MSNSPVDPDQGRHSVGPDLGPNCLHFLYLSADDKSLLARKEISTPWAR